jgi:hypothetical protein
MNKKEYNKKYQREHKKEISIQRKQYRQEHKIEIKEQKHKEYLKNKQKYLDRAKKYGKLYYELNKNRISNIHKEYYKNHKEESKLRISKYQRNRKKIDINFKIRSYLATRLYSALKRNTKTGHTLELLGCSIKQLKDHLAKHFTKGMSFSNYGKWHIDHIRPCASFDLSKPSEQRKCFHYTNLQPLWAKDNLSKSKKLY